MIFKKIGLVLLTCLVFSPLMAEDIVFSTSNHTELNESKKTIIFIHGSPGDHKAFKKYQNDEILNENFNMIFVDRPGYGNSKKFKSQPKMPEQAELIYSELETKYKINSMKAKVFIFSHSYGAPLSILVSKKIIVLPNLILVAGPFNPDFNMKRWYNYFAALPLIKFAIGNSWRFSNEEMMVLNSDLKIVKEELSKYKGKTYFVHGRSDGIVPIKHSRWAHSLREKLNFDSEILEYPSNHFIIWNNYKKMRNLILDLE